MSAPLYSRYCRYAQREAKRFPRASLIRCTVPKWKRSDTRVYSLSERASYEAGWWSGESPGEILRAISMHELPSDRVWIELDWRAMQQGSFRVELRSDYMSEGLLGKSVASMVDEHGKIPLRVGMLLTRDRALSTPLYDEGDPLICGFMFYLYENGACFFGPGLSIWSNGKSVVNAGETLLGVKDMPEDTEKLARQIAFSGIGNNYAERWKDKHPRQLVTLRRATYLTILGNYEADLEPHSKKLRDMEGTTRLMIAALTACLSAKRAKPNEPADAIEKATQEPRRANRYPIEVDLFMRERGKPGKSLRASVGAIEGIKKGLHSVGAHWAYRATKDGSDPTICPVTQFGMHDWEHVPESKSEVCILCQQKRWRRDAHQRGDERYGVVPQKIHNVRVG